MVNAFLTVAVMLLYAVPGFIMIKTRLVSDKEIGAFARLLLYVCQPALIVNSFLQIDASSKSVGEMVIVFGVMTGIICAVLAVMYLIMGKSKNKRCRIYIIASCFGNFQFMGIPILQALLPEYPEAVVLSSMGSLAMNLIGWTVGSAIITHDARYISVKKVFINPCVLSLAVAIPLFAFGIKLPEQIDGMVALLAKMSTPLCMIIMGMRLAASHVHDIFGHEKTYYILAVKQLAVPLLTFLIVLLLPIDPNIRATIFIMMCCPVASIVLNFAEMLGEGQRTAASLMLLGTMLSAVTIPVMTLLIPFLY
ncbi:MAG: AEC family transporter [Clostridia bacterium]|nr:AEC family transporter [Clostridia bacterium]